jgi:hypothetical protein
MKLQIFARSGKTGNFRLAIPRQNVIIGVSRIGGPVGYGLSVGAQPDPTPD